MNKLPTKTHPIEEEEEFSKLRKPSISYQWYHQGAGKLESLSSRIWESNIR